MLVYAYIGPSAWLVHQLLLVASRVYVCLPVGFHLIRPLKRPISSSSVHGSFSRSWWASSASVGVSATGVGVFGCEVGVGDVAWETRARFRGGIVDVCIQ